MERSMNIGLQAATLKPVTDLDCIVLNPRL